MRRGGPTFRIPHAPLNTAHSLYVILQVLSKEEEDAEYKAKWTANNFNQFKSDRISLHRDIKDTRHENCKNLIFDVDKLPTTSIIIPFHNEARTTLLRTVWTALDRSPPRLIKEVGLAWRICFCERPPMIYVHPLPCVLPSFLPPFSVDTHTRFLSGPHMFTRPLLLFFAPTPFLDYLG